MAFAAETCPNCDAAVAKSDAYCGVCGVPSASAFSTCSRCHAAVGSDAAFCWQCGLKQPPPAGRALYDQRWRRSATDFLWNVDLASPARVLVHGLQVDDGTLALVFQGGCYHGLLEPGYYPTDTFRARLEGVDVAQSLRAVLLDSQAAEVDFVLENVRTEGQATVDVRLRLLFQVVEPKLFVTEFVKEAGSLTTADFSSAFAGDVRAAVQSLLGDCSLAVLAGEFRVRELLEGEVLERLSPVLGRVGLEATGVRLAELGGAAVTALRDKLGRVSELNEKLEVDRRLRDALRREKVEAFRDEQSLQEYLAKIQHQSELRGAKRDEAKQIHLQGREHRIQLAGIQQDYERRRTEIFQRLDQQKLRHEGELAETRKDLQVRQLAFDADLAQQSARFDVGQQQQLAQGRTAEELAQGGLALYEKSQRLKHETAQRDAYLRLEIEERQIHLRSHVSLQTLVATLPADQAERVLRLVELETLKGRSLDQSAAAVTMTTGHLRSGDGADEKAIPDQAEPKSSSTSVAPNGGDSSEP